MDQNLRVRDNKETKTRSQSDTIKVVSPPLLTVYTSKGTVKTVNSLKSVEIKSWKMKKSRDSQVYTVYCIHMSLYSGLQWTIERRYSQFRNFRKELNKTVPPLAEVKFPSKQLLFNLSKSSIIYRQQKLNEYLNEIVAYEPLPVEISKCHILFFEL